MKKKDRNRYMLIGWNDIDHIKYNRIPLTQILFVDILIIVIETCLTLQQTTSA